MMNEIVDPKCIFPSGHRALTDNIMFTTSSREIYAYDVQNKKRLSTGLKYTEKTNIHFS